MRYYLIAGEASGDLHGANLMKNILNTDPHAEFRFWGGDLMFAQGGHRVMHYNETAFMGLSDVILNIRKIFKFLKFCKQDILEFKPDALILIDYPGFNLKIATFAKNHKIPTHYYISPKVWAWNTKRALKIRRDIDYLYSILPFETDFYKSYGVKPDYIGNPLCDAIESYPFDNDFKAKHGLNKPYIALLPGSRMSELKHVLPTMLATRDKFKDYEFVLAGANHISDDIYKSYLSNYDVRLIKGQTYDVLNHAHAALVCSGTATLETALLNCPQVVCYRFSNLSYQIGKLVIKVKYISLVNLIMDRKLVSELIQGDFTPENTARELKKILDGPDREAMLKSYAALRIKVGAPGASQRAAELIVKRTLRK
ncbi:MAG: lipid-A-disaccharide synthase [Bacteroidia bacterium]|nr:lipid-A-disaccharide synthase [Bacteroidia bacterium]